MQFNTYENPFAATSPWNRKPVNPVFGSETIPDSSYFPCVHGGKYSTGIFKALATDPAVTVHAYAGQTINDTDGYTKIQSITIPHWPSDLVAATGEDGHADIVDEASDTIHSFYQLKQINGVWFCNQYSTCKLSSIGWPTPAKPTQGSRAVGVPASAGLIRMLETVDGLPYYPHALAMSLAANGLAGRSTVPYTGLFTAHDNDISMNTGSIPYGSLLMLPPDFPENQGNLDLRKVVKTLKTFGAYVVDRNVGTPFVIYVENYKSATIPGFNLHKNGKGTTEWNKWDGVVASELVQIQHALRVVKSAEDWLDGNGNSMSKPVVVTSPNILTLIGKWTQVAGKVAGVLDATRQAIVWPKGSGVCSQYSGDSSLIKSIPIVSGTPYVITAKCTGGAQIRLTIRKKTDSTILIDSGRLADGQVYHFKWGDVGTYLMISMISGDGSVESTVSATIVAE